MRLPACLSAAAVLACTGPEVNLELLLTGQYFLVAVDGQVLPAVINVEGSTLTIASERLTAVRTAFTLEDQASVTGPNGTADLSISCKLDAVALTRTRFSLVPAAENGCPFSTEVTWVDDDQLFYTRDGRLHQLLRVPCEDPVGQASPPAGGPLGAPEVCLDFGKPPG